MAASVWANTLPIWSQDGLPANVRRPNGRQTFLNTPGSSYHHFLKTSVRRPGNSAANPRVGGFHLFCTESDTPDGPGRSSLQTHSQRRMRKTHHLDGSPSLSLLIHKMGS